MAFFDVLAQPMLQLWGTTLSRLEVFGFATGILCVWWTVRKNVWNFPMGMLNSALLGLLFFHSRLFADAGLQLVFIVLAAMGWWQWAQTSTASVKNELPVQKLSVVQRWQVVGILLFCIAVLYQGLIWLKGDVPFFDAAITAMSIVAQVLLNRRYVENWSVWVAVDMVSIPVYIYKELYLIALLYVVFLALACFGWRAWRSSLETERGGYVSA